MKSVGVFAVLVLLVSVAVADYYSTLGVSRTATKREIKKAYRRMSMKKHPDKGGDKEEWARITEAYEALTDPDKRRVYDQFGEEGLKRQQEGGGRRGGGGMFNNIFDFFGGGSRGAGGRQGDMPKSADIEFPLEVTLKDLYVGREFRVNHQRQKLCDHCRGTGADSPEDMKTCTQCRGSGIVIKKQRLGPGFITQSQHQCPKCGGKGKIVSKVCHVCHGTKVDTGHEWLTVVVERGMRDGSRITFEGQTDEQPGVQPGDLIFVVLTDPHEIFEREGDDLHVTFTITLVQALAGFSEELEHLDGHKVTIANTGVTIPGQILKIEDEGMPIQEYGSEAGDLFVKIVVEFPTELTPKQVEDVSAVLNQAKWKGRR